MKSSVLVSLIASVLAIVSAVSAAETRTVDVGPLDAYGEMPQESANKRLVFEWLDLAIKQQQPQQAFEKYVSKQFKEHSHLLRKQGQDAAGYTEKLAEVTKQAEQFKKGVDLGLPKQAAVNGEMVTLYGRTLDIYRVENGRITDHWDASPAQTITIKEHAPGTAVNVMKPSTVTPPPLTAEELNPDLSKIVIDPVSTGPVSPYGESPQEAANKKIVFEYSQLAWLRGNFPAAYAKYFSRDFRAHSHILTRGKSDYVGYAENLASSMAAQKRMVASGVDLAVPKMATANGDLVIMFGEGIDIHRVVNGKITDSWNASPPTTVTLQPPPTIK
ncbi:MAG: hypothetical protein QM808_05090 [Steroidobacteraceae bacterium]